MKPKPQPRDAFELFQSHFSACAGTHADRDQLLDPRHELVRLAKMIDWPGRGEVGADSLGGLRVNSQSVLLRTFGDDAERVKAAVGVQVANPKRCDLGTSQADLKPD